MKQHINNSSCRARRHQKIVVLLVWLISAAAPSMAQKNDTLYFMNGDRISGEFKSFKYGYLNIKTYGVSTVNVKFDKISTFFSRKSYDILLKDGRRRFGSFDTSNVARNVKIVVTNDTILTPLVEIVEITPILNRFWKRIDGNLDIGYSYTRANTLSQFTFSSEIKYTQRKYYSSLKLYALNSDQENSISTRKNDASIAFFRRVKNDWFTVGGLGAEQNSELGLDLRVQGLFGFSNEVIHTNSNNLMAVAGVVVNREWSADTNLIRTNFDALASLSYRLFMFRDPEISVTSYLTVFPSFSVADRVRVNYDIKLKVKIITDMYISLDYYINFDNKPTSETSGTTDYSITTSLGYTF